ncbi:hypothetical protein ACN27G_29500 [Plantactinospora sp. WMMB334]
MTRSGLTPRRNSGPPGDAGLARCPEAAPERSGRADTAETVVNALTAHRR